MATEIQGGVIARDVSDGQIVEGLAVASSIRQTLRLPDRASLTDPGLVLQAGDSAYIISENAWLLYNGSGWNDVYSDSGWVNLTLQSGYTASVPAPAIRRVGSVVQLRGRFNREGASSSDAFYIPLAFRPSSTHYWEFLRPSSGSDQNCGIFTSDGAFRVGSGDFTGLGLSSVMYFVN